MRKMNYPSWSDWQKQLEKELAACMTFTGLTDYRINGAATKLQIPVKNPDAQVARLPYVQIMMHDVQDGHDDENSGQDDVNKRNYINIGDGVQIKTGETIRESVTWLIEGFTQKQEEALIIAQTIKRYFNCYGVIHILWQNKDDYAYSKLHDYSIETAEADRAGNIEFYRVSWLITLKVKSELLTPDERVKAIADIVVETAVLQDGGEIESPFTKTIT